MRALSLCSGIGGLDVAAELAGIEPAAFVEIDPFCQSVLRTRWPGVPVLSDLYAVDETVLRQVGAYDVEAIIGGIPCQPFSDAGKRLAEKDARHLWPEAYRLVRLIRPRWVVIENVSGFVSRALPLVADDLVKEGYHVTPLLVPASAAGAPHLRKRVFVVAERLADAYDSQPYQQQSPNGATDGRTTTRGAQLWPGGHSGAGHAERSRHEGTAELADADGAERRT